MNTTYEVWLSTSTGNRLALLDNFISLKYVRAQNAAGAFSVVLPPTIDRALLRSDQMIEIWRSAEGQSAQLDFLGLIRQIQTAEQNFIRTITLSGEDGNSLLGDRIVAYAANSAQAKVNGKADNAMKLAVKENMGASCTDTERDLSAYGVTIAPYTSLGPTIERRYAWDCLINVLQDFADMAYEEGTRLYFDMVPRIVSNTQLAWQFETYINQLGADRTYSSGNPTIFSSEWGNLVNPVLTDDWTSEKTCCYVGGKGEEENRKVQEVQASNLINFSPWARREFFYNAPNQTSTTSALTKIGRRQLRMNRGRALFTGQLLSTPQTRYGIEWRMGDRVTASFDGRQFDGPVSPVSITVDRKGEKIDARLEVI
jgi:hypothetical protein